MHSYCDTYFIVWLQFMTQTTYDTINGPGGIIYLIILGPAGPFVYPDQISHYRGHIATESLPANGSNWICVITHYQEVHLKHINVEEPTAV